MGEIADVVPGEPVESAWGNAVRDRSIQRYADQTALDGSVPIPVQGDVAYLLDSDTFQIHDGSVWQPWPGSVQGDARWLRLDAANSPLTAALSIVIGAPGPALVLHTGDTTNDADHAELRLETDVSGERFGAIVGTRGPSSTWVGLRLDGWSGDNTRQPAIEVVPLLDSIDVHIYGRLHVPAGPTESDPVFLFGDAEGSSLMQSRSVGGGLLVGTTAIPIVARFGATGVNLPTAYPNTNPSPPNLIITSNGSLLRSTAVLVTSADLAALDARVAALESP